MGSQRVGQNWSDLAAAAAVHIYNGTVPSHRKEWNNTICSSMDEPKDYHIKWSKSDRKRQIGYNTSYMWNLKKNIQIKFITKQR